MPKEKSAPNKMASLSDDCDHHWGKRTSKSKSSRRKDVYVSPYQPNSSSDEEYISDTSVRRKKMPKSKNMYVKGRKIKSWKKLKVKTLTVTVSLKTTKLANDVRVVNRGGERKAKYKTQDCFKQVDL